MTKSSAPASIPRMRLAVSSSDVTSTTGINRVARVLLDRPARLEPVDVRHHHVHQDEIGRLGSNEAQRFGSVTSRPYGVAVGREQRFEQPALPASHRRSARTPWVQPLHYDYRGRHFQRPEGPHRPRPARTRRVLRTSGSSTGDGIATKLTGLFPFGQAPGARHLTDSRPSSTDATGLPRFVEEPAIGFGRQDVRTRLPFR